MVTGGDFELLDILQAAIGDSQRWFDAIAALANGLGADNGHLITAPTGNAGPPIVETVGLSDEHIDRFGSERAAALLDPYLHQLPTGRPILQEEVISDREFERSSLYNEIIRPAGGFHSLHFRSQEREAG